MVQIEKKNTYTGHSDAIYTLERGIYPFQFYSAGGDGHVVVWDLNSTENGRLIAKVQSSIYSLRLLPGRNFLIVGENYEGVHVIDVMSHQEVGSLQFTKSAIFDMKVQGDSLFVATGEGKLFVIDIPTLKVMHEVKCCDQNLRDIVLTEGGNCLVASSDGCIRKFDSDIQLIDEVHAHEKSVFALCKHGESLISGSRDARLKFWDTSERLELNESINAHMYAINDIAARQDGAYLATASMDKTIKIWDYAQRKLIKVIDKARHQGHLSSVNKLLWLSYNDYLISCSDDRSIGVWHIDI